MDEAVLRTTDTEPTIVIDPGSAYFKAGIAGASFVPQVVFDSVIGKPKFPGPLQGMGDRCRYIGDEALTKRLALDLSWPIDKGRIVDFDAMEQILNFTFTELNVTPEEHPILFGEGSFIPQDQREKLAQLCYEKFNVRGFFAAHEAILSAYGSGRSTALIIDFGANKTDIIPVQEAASHSIVISDAISRLNIGGDQLTDFLMKLLPESGYSFQSQVERDIVREVKEKICYVAKDAETEKADYAMYTLPDGQVMKVSQQRYQVPEAYFRPSMVSELEDGLQKIIASTLDVRNHESMVFLRKDLAENCIVCGGGSLFPGLGERIEKELMPLSPVDADGFPKWNIRVDKPAHRKYTTWFGGSTIAPLCPYTTREDFDEVGHSLVNQTLF